MGEIDLGDVQKLLDELLGGGMDFQELVREGVGGEGLFSGQKLASLLQRIFLDELMAQKQMWIHILVLAVAAAALVHFADVFQNKGVSRISFCMIYMLLFSILLVSFRGSMGIAREVLENIRRFMTVLAPAYFLAMTLTSYITSAGIYYEFVLLLISGVRWLMEAFVLPCIEVYVLLALVDGLSGEERLSRFTELISMAVGWSLKAAVALVMGFHMVQGLVSPAADEFRTMTVARGLDMIPGIGSVGGAAADMALGSAMLIKNGIGAAALAALILLCLVPLVKLLIIMAAYYLLSAVLQPISDERITGCLTGMGNGVRLLFQAVFTALLLFFLTVALTTAATGR